MSDQVEALRAQLRPLVGGPDEAFAVAWAPFVDLGVAAEVIDGHMSDEQATAKLRAWVNSGRSVHDAESLETERGGELGDHQAALSVVWASQVGRDEGVLAYRSDHLPHLLTTSDELRTWITDQMVTVTGSSEDEVWEKVMRSSVKWRNFEGLPEFQWTTGAPVLEELKRQANRVSRRYGGWKEPEATTFILTGAVPTIPMIRARMGGRIVLDVHPDTPASEVQRFYTEARTSVVPGRPRLLSAQVAAAVVAAHTVPGTWDARNLALQRGGHGGYATGDDMRRTVERAEAKLLGDRPGHRPVDQMRRFAQVMADGADG